MMNNVTIDIAGNNYTLRTDEDPEYLKQLANLVTVKILEIKRDTNASAVDCATMAALDIADNYYKEKQKKKSSSSRKKAATAATEEQEPATLI